MADPTDNTTRTSQRFPFITVALAVVMLFAFLVLVIVVYKSPNQLDQPKPEDTEAKEEPQRDPDAMLAEVKQRNEAALNGVGAKMSVRAAHAELMKKLKGPNEKLPFPTPEPPTKIDDKEKQP